MTTGETTAVRTLSVWNHLVPMHLYARRSRVLLERSLRVQRYAWTAVLSGFFEPVFYLLAMGAGLGSIIGTVATAAGPVSYASYLAPALLATSAMNGAIYDSVHNVYFKLRFAKLYDVMLATSLGPVDIALGEIGWSLVRGGTYSVGFVLVMLVGGLLHSVWAVLAIPAALLIAFGFAAVGMAITTFLKTFQHLDLVTVAMLPMFLFSTTFYPLGVYPRGIQLLVEALPLFHGIELMRGLCLGAVGPALLGHAAYFLVMAAVGIAVAARRLDRLLLR